MKFGGDLKESYNFKEIDDWIWFVKLIFERIVEGVKYVNVTLVYNKPHTYVLGKNRQRLTGEKRKG